MWSSSAPLSAPAPCPRQRDRPVHSVERHSPLVQPDCRVVLAHPLGHVAGHGARHGRVHAGTPGKIVEGAPETMNRTVARIPASFSALRHAFATELGRRSEPDPRGAVDGAPRESTRAQQRAGSSSGRVSSDSLDHVTERDLWTGFSRSRSTYRISRSSARGRKASLKRRSRQIP